jgi:hypothetical protein
MRRAVLRVPAELPLSEVRRVLQEHVGALVVVMSEDAALGVLGLDDITRIASLADLLARGGVRRPVAAGPETSA